MLTPAGYAVLENFTTQEEVRRMREQAEKLMRDYDAGDGDAAVFSTTNQVRLPMPLSITRWGYQCRCYHYHYQFHHC